MPLPEPPDVDVDVVLTQLRIARDSLAVADERVAKVTAWAAEPDLGWPDQMTLRILRQARELEATLWAREVGLLEQAARLLGLQP
jgi:hypothetical protein